MIYSPESFVKYKDLPNLNTMFGNIGQSWTNPLPNDLFIKGVPKNVFSGVGAGNVGTGLDTLFAFAFPATSFKQNGANARIIVDGLFGSNDDNKRIAVGFDATTVFDTALQDIDGNGFRIVLDILRIDATHVNLTISNVFSLLVVNSAGAIVSGGFHTAAITFNNLAVQNMDTGSDNSLLVTGESATATNDNVLVNQALIDLVRF